MIAARDNQRLMDERLLFNRKLLTFAHVMVGLLSAFWYFAQIDRGHYPYWHSRVGLAAVAIVAPAVVPYVVSGVYAWRVATHRRLRVLAFLMVLIAGAILMGMLFSGALGIRFNAVEWLATATTQAFGYVWAAELLLHVI